jgi:Heparinase II/III-like protein/Heparinase II/III N-terminus
MSVALARSAKAPRSLPRITVRFDAELAAPERLAELRLGRFTALGETHAIGTPVDWRHNPSSDIEWLIVLNKFYHAPGLVRAWIETRDPAWLALWKAQSRVWIATMEPGFIAADVTGRRLQNWVYALSLWAEDGSDRDPEFADLIAGSLARQADWLRGNLHPSRNHRTLELLALLLVAVWLGQELDADWAITELADNAAADFMPDGVHVELSSHYHCLALRNLIDACKLARDNGIGVPEKLDAVVARASHFAAALHKPDGTIPALSDADIGDYRELFDPDLKPGLVEVFPDAGYVFLRDEAAASGEPDGHYLVFDCGPIGAGNHGHLDCLAFELAALGRSLVVDPGRYTYFEGGPVNERAAFRSTAAHSVVQVDGREQTAYRQGPKRMKIGGPSPEVALLEADKRSVRARMASREYAVVNERTILRGEQGWWLVHDRLESAEDHTYASRLQLADDAQDCLHKVVLPDGTEGWAAPNLLIVPISSHLMTCEIEQAWIAPRYGERLLAPRLKLEQRAADGWFSILLLPFRGGLPDIAFSADGAGYAVRVGDGPTERGIWP